MNYRTFPWFILSSALATLLLIAAPILPVLIQSAMAPDVQVTSEVEICDVVDCTETVVVDAGAAKALLEAGSMRRFVGTGICTDRDHLALPETGPFWSASSGPADFIGKPLNLPSRARSS